MKIFVAGFITFSLNVVSYDMLECKFASDTDLKTGRTHTQAYYDEQGFLHKDNNVFVEVDKSKKTLKFFPNDGIYSTFLYAGNKGKQHNGLSDGSYHQIQYQDSGSSIEWNFVLFPSNNPKIWRHKLNRFTRKLTIQYENYWINEYDCKKSDSLF